MRLRVVVLAVVVLVFSVGCEGEPHRICDGATCTAAQWQEAFDTAVNDLHATGVDIVPASWDDPVALDALARRMATLTGVSLDDVPGARYVDSGGYCGPGGPGGATFPAGFVGQCLNRACYEHDRCYEGVDGLEAVCYWSETTTFCDASVVAELARCRAEGLCGLGCQFVGGLMIGLSTECTVLNVVLHPWLAEECAREARCGSCVGTTDPPAYCAHWDLACDPFVNGCGEPISCGVCAPGGSCRTDVSADSRACACPGAPACTGHGTCSAAGACACDPGWSGTDCASAVPACGDGACAGGESCSTCPADCGPCPGCGDGTCGGAESCASCPSDCGPCPCGNGTCGAGESCSTCPADCGACPTCPDGVCGSGESCQTCAADCGTCPTCGNGTCGAGESCNTCPTDCGACPCACDDQDLDGHYPLFCTDPTCGFRDDCDDGVASVYQGATELCDGRDNDCDVEIDDNATCWVPVYRFWDPAAPLATRPRCFGNTTSAPGLCAGYTLEFPGPVFFAYTTSVPGTVEFLAFDRTNNADHLVVRAGTTEAASLAMVGSGWALRGSIGFLWADVTTAPPGQYYRPADALSATVRDLRRYREPSTNLHVFPNNPIETAPGWVSEGTRAWVWGSRW